MSKSHQPCSLFSFLSYWQQGTQRSVFFLLLLLIGLWWVGDSGSHNDGAWDGTQLWHGARQRHQVQLSSGQVHHGCNQRVGSLATYLQTGSASGMNLFVPMNFLLLMRDVHICFVVVSADQPFQSAWWLVQYSFVTLSEEELLFKGVYLMTGVSLYWHCGWLGLKHQLTN